MPAELIILAILQIALVLYAILAGADFGAGIWELILRSPASSRDRKLIDHAMGPVWEANHVWIIFALIAVLNGFPSAFATLSSALWLPWLLALAGIVFRGAGFAFRSAPGTSADSRRRWEWVFAAASVAAPCFLGASAGAIASGKLPLSPTGEFIGDPFFSWINPLSFYSAVLALGACTFLAAVYLNWEARIASDSELETMWRRRALTIGVLMGVLAPAGLLVVAVAAPDLWTQFRIRAWPLVVISLASGSGTLVALFYARPLLAAVGAASAVASMMVGWGVAQYPLLVPPTLTVEAAKSPPAVLHAMLWGIGGTTVLVIPSLAYLWYLFKSGRLKATGDPGLVEPSVSRPGSHTH